ncbi:ABC transporter ATP-binding protein [Vineibacter terrae]|uniref:ABC transporter ATP-binding protein n=1 Tax=Vineibacter terrae TaxID=2586908 RepID=UPI002E376C6B|nr:ABC transporter ATP-binding protein [Vineibacter terrae]HEX2888759.1 ABC transporter ATP-binding protein [Vineibacter terrae]
MTGQADAPHISVDHVNKRFQTASRAQLQALKDVSFSATRGEFISIVGPSGCGKSTLLYIVAGLLDASDGTVTVDDARVTGPSPDRGVVLQNFSIFPWRRVIDNVAYGPEMRGASRQERRRIARQYLETVGLGEFAEYFPRELSGGMKQRIAIAQMLACNPSIFLMDEPFGALDALTREVLQEQLLRLWERDRKTVLFVTHSIDEAVLLSDRVIVMATRPGRIKEIVPIDLPRPRRAEEIRALPQFGTLRKHIWASIRAETLEMMQ